MDRRSPLEGIIPASLIKRSTRILAGRSPQLQQVPRDFSGSIVQLLGSYGDIPRVIDKNDLPFLKRINPEMEIQPVPAVPQTKLNLNTPSKKENKSNKYKKEKKDPPSQSNIDLYA